MSFSSLIIKLAFGILFVFEVDIKFLKNEDIN